MTIRHHSKGIRVWEVTRAVVVVLVEVVVGVVEEEAVKAVAKAMTICPSRKRRLRRR